MSAITLDPYGYASRSPLDSTDPSGLYSADSAERYVDAGYAMVNAPWCEGGYGFAMTNPAADVYVAGIVPGSPDDYSNNDGGPHRPALSQAEKEAVDQKVAGDPTYDEKLYNSARQKIKEAQKNVGQRGSSGSDTQRRHDFHITPAEVVAGVVVIGGVTILTGGVGDVVFLL